MPDKPRIGRAWIATLGWLLLSGWITLPLGAAGSAPAVGDHDRDGAPDVVGAAYDGTNRSLSQSASPSTTGADHLLLCEVALSPAEGEFIEIVNPTDAAEPLDDYYLSDTDEYALVPGGHGGSPAPSIGTFDFIVRFPLGTTIGPGEVLVVALDGAGFETTYGFKADFEVIGTDPDTPDMLAEVVGSARNLRNLGEPVVLFFWDGATDLVTDVDVVRVGRPDSPNDIGDKTGVSVDGPDGDGLASTYLPDAGTMPVPSGDPGSGESAKRILLEGSSETATGGNGMPVGAPGHDETSEDIHITWDREYLDDYLAPDPGTCCFTPECHYASAETINSTALRASLHEIIDDHQRLTYDEMWDFLEFVQEDPSDSTQIIDLYKNAPHPKDPRTYEREHTWPSSYGFPKESLGKYPFSDGHHLFLANESYNGSRSNKPYRYCDASCEEKQTEEYDGRGGGTGNYPGNSNWTKGVRTEGTWETWLGRRGDVARALLYMDVRYDGSDHTDGTEEVDLILTDDPSQLNSDRENAQDPAYMGILSDLLQWHEEDPVDDRERLRNELIYLYQRNRNPFIDHPEWVRCIHGNVCPGVDLTVVKDDGWVEVLPGETVTYTIEVGNLGADDVMGALVTDTVDPAAFDVGAVSWTCTPSPGAGPGTNCPGSGTATDLGAGVTVSIEAGDTVLFTVEAPVLASASGELVNSAEAQAPEGIVERDATSNASTDTDAILENGSCGHPDQRTLTNRAIDGVEEFVACVSIFAGAGMEVVSPGALTLRAGERVALGDGFRVGEGGSLEVVIDGSLPP